MAYTGPDYVQVIALDAADLGAPGTVHTLEKAKAAPYLDDGRALRYSKAAADYVAAILAPRPPPPPVAPVTPPMDGGIPAGAEERMVRVVLTSAVEGLGAPGDVVRLPDAAARAMLDEARAVRYRRSRGSRNVEALAASGLPPAAPGLPATVETPPPEPSPAPRVKK